MPIELPYQTWEKIKKTKWPGGKSPEVVATLKRYGITSAPGSEDANLALQQKLLAERPPEVTALTKAGEMRTQLTGTTAPTLPSIEKELERIRGQVPGIQTRITELAKEKGKKLVETPTGWVAEPLAAPVTPSAPIAAPVTEKPVTKTGLGKFTTGEYDIGKIQTELASASAEKKKAYDAMVGLQTSLYDTEYQKAGLADVKTKIAGVDTDIANKKAKRDQLMLDEQGKPIPQWMITGRLKKEVDAATIDLNQLIDQRNSLASEYNTGLETVTRKVEYGIKDASTKYGYWESEENRLSNLSKTYQATLAAELSRGEKAEQWAKEFGLEEKLYELKAAEAAAGGDKRYALVPIYKKDYAGRTTDEIIGYFNPATGETSVYTPEETGGAAPAEGGTTPAEGGTTPAEGISRAKEADIRTVVNESLNSGQSADALKFFLANIKLEDSSKTTSQIVDEEVKKREGGKSIWSKVWRFIK